MIEKEIIKVVKYFDFFDYAPSFDEIYLFLEQKISKANFEKELKKMLHVSRLPAPEAQLMAGTACYMLHNRQRIYCLQGREKILKLKNLRQKITSGKISKIRHFLTLVKLFPQISLVGLSGSAAMGNCQAEDDVDLFVISAPGRLWTGRAICLALAYFVGLKRKRGIGSGRGASDKICLNLFFDGSDLAVPKNKRSYYTAHEVLQMRPNINKTGMYVKFIIANKWVFEIFPNAIDNLKWDVRNGRWDFDNLNFRLFEVKKDKFAPQKNREIKKSESKESHLAHQNFIVGLLENLLKQFQLYFINRHKTTEIISETQLWFHPEDFAKKMKFDKGSSS